MKTALAFCALLMLAPAALFAVSDRSQPATQPLKVAASYDEDAPMVSVSLVQLTGTCQQSLPDALALGAPEQTSGPAFACVAE